jgi:DNA-binding transcriptional LysR family regulator
MADRRLQVFYTVAKQLSFTKAAEQLFMTQPAVTFQVKQLEEHFNTRLFDRSHGRIALTPAGRLVLDYAERVLALTEEMDARVGDLTGSVAGALSLGASMTIAEYILPKILGEFKAAHPEVRAHMSVANSETIVNRVADHSLDVGLIESPSYLPTLQIEACGEDELVVICAPGHALTRLQAVRPQDLAAAPWVRREPGSGTREFTDNYLRECNIAPDDLDVTMELGSPEAMKSLVETGICIAVVSRATVVKELALGSLVARSLAPRLIRTLSHVQPNERFRSRLLTTFVDFAKRRMRETAVAAQVS